MQKKKTILFITHSNNDLDHFLPLFVEFKKDKRIIIKVIAFYNKYDILKNKLHKYICNNNDVDADSMTDISYLKTANTAILKIYRYVIDNVKPARQRETGFKKIQINFAEFFKETRNSLLRFFHFSLFKYFQLYSIIFLTNKKIFKYIDSNNIHLAIIDHRSIEELMIDAPLFVRFKNVVTKKSDPMNHVLFRFAKRVRDRNIPLMMIPHGPQPILIEMPDEYGTLRPLSKPFRSDYVVIGGRNEFTINRNIRNGGLKETLFLGDPRFDLKWINYLESCALKVYESVVQKPKNRKVLLYLMDNFQYSLVENQEYKLEMHKDILTLVNDFQELEVWVKHHPRRVFDLPVKDFINPDRQKNIKQFGNNVDIHILTANADVCLSASSTAFISPILQKKPVIFYDKWKEKFQGVTSIFDNLKFKASSKEELRVRYKQIINGEYTIDDSFLQSFFTNVFSLDSPYTSMTEKYCDKIKEIIEIDHN